MLRSQMLQHFIVSHDHISPFSKKGHPIKGGFIQNATANAVCGDGQSKTN